MIDITGVVAEITDFFTRIYQWLITHGITIGDFSFSFFDLVCSLLVLTTVVWVFVPWFASLYDDEYGGIYDDDDDD